MTKAWDNFKLFKSAYIHHFNMSITLLQPVTTSLTLTSKQSKINHVQTNMHW